MALVLLISLDVAFPNPDFPRDVWFGSLARLARCKTLAKVPCISNITRPFSATCAEIPQDFAEVPITEQFHSKGCASHCYHPRNASSYHLTARGKIGLWLAASKLWLGAPDDAEARKLVEGARHGTVRAGQHHLPARGTSAC